MKHFFIDTNVIIDFLADRKPFSQEATELFYHANEKNMKLYLSAVSYNNIYYIVRQSMSNNQTIKLLTELSDTMEIVDVTKQIIKDSLKSNFKDFEDAIQYHCAISNSKIEGIITRNSKDFKLSTIPILNPKEALSLIKR